MCWHCLTPMILYHSCRWDRQQYIENWTVNNLERFEKTREEFLRFWKDLSFCLQKREKIFKSLYSARAEHRANLFARWNYFLWSILYKERTFKNSRFGTQINKPDNSGRSTFNMRVWSWLRMNAGGVLNTCKSNEALYLISFGIDYFVTEWRTGE